MNIDLMTNCIETDRLVLFPFGEESLALFNRDLSAFEKTYGVRYCGEELDFLHTNFLKKLHGEIQAAPNDYLFFTEFLIIVRQTDCVVGSIDFKYVPRNGVTEVGYGLNPAHEGHGYMTEALDAFLRFGRAHGVRTVRAETLADNIKSQNVLKRCGFTCVGKDGNMWWQKQLDKEEYGV